MSGLIEGEEASCFSLNRSYKSRKCGPIGENIRSRDRDCNRIAWHNSQVIPALAERPLYKLRTAARFTTNQGFHYFRAGASSGFPYIPFVFAFARKRLEIANCDCWHCTTPLMTAAPRSSHICQSRLTLPVVGGPVVWTPDVAPRTCE